MFTVIGINVFNSWQVVFIGLVASLTAVFAVVMLLFSIGLLRLRRNRIIDLKAWPSVSVIVPARNEADILPWSISSLMRQDYPGNWEVIVVDDRSEDDSPAVLETLVQRYPNLRSIRIVEEPGSSPKKRALAKGITSSQAEVVVTTDADCQYHTDWLRSMVSHLADDVGVVAGLTIFDLPNFKSVPVWQKVQWIDFFVQNFLAAGSLGWGHAASCNGSNLCFRREVYDQVSGYGESAAVISGDDVLFAQRVAALTSWRMVFATTPDTIVRSLPVCSVRDLIHQRLRWASKGLTYRGSMLAFLFTVYFYYSALIALPVASLLSPAMLLPSVLIWTTKLLADTILFLTGAKVFNQQRLLPYFPLYEVVHVVFTPFFGIAGLLLPYHWKGDWYRTAKLPGNTGGYWFTFRNRSRTPSNTKKFVRS